MKDNIEFIEKYCQAARKDYYRHERINLESNMIERSKEEDINVKLMCFYAGIYTVMGAGIIGTGLVLLGAAKISKKNLEKKTKVYSDLYSNKTKQISKENQYNE